MGSALAGCGEGVKFDDAGTVAAKEASRRKPDLPTRIVCVENGSVILDEFVREEDGGHVSQNQGYIAYAPRSDSPRSTVMGTCSVHPQTIPANWKPLYPGA